MASIETPRLENERPLSGKIIRSVAFGGLRSLLVAPVPFLLTPLILKKIGAAGYGTWAVFLTINGLTSLADLGLVGAVSKFVAEYKAREDYLALSRLLNTGLVVFGVLSLALTTLFWVATPFVIASLFRGSSLSAAPLTFLLRFFLLVISSNILILLFSSVTTGLQRLDLTYLLNAFNVIFAAVVGAVLLLRGWALSGLVFGQICASALTLLGYVVLVRVLLPQVKLNPGRFDMKEAGHIFDFSLRLYLTQVAVAIHNNIEKLLLASFVGVEAAGWYDIAYQVAIRIRGMIGLLLGPVLPAASELGALNDNHRLGELYFRSHKYLAFVGVPIVAFVFLVSKEFVELWIGPRFYMVATPLSVLLLVNFINLVTGPGFLILAGNGNLGPGMRSAAVGLVLNVLASTILILRLGFAGAVAGTSVALILASLYFMYLFQKEMGYPLARLLREGYWRPVVWSLGLTAGLFLLHPASKFSWVGLALEGLLFATLYFFGLLFTRFFDGYDWAKVEGAFPLIRHARGIIPIA